ncbi:hypothetical protein AKJ09_07742 [Labilithrix luteola]|uniref:Uncharacterized protein n=1 Tax=Labilithrix luteola TaxID=1391654 RepID=A0A0K1Q5S2_9BACT|nr:hypothetical protein [Labilithrix luteola]AKV01079.1 hypothetical protein AKJ09_07742 [Labilithrix luteola]
MGLSVRRGMFAFAIFSALPLLVACPKKETPQVDAAPPPAPAVVEDAAPTLLVPMEEDAATDAAADADAAKKATGPGVPTNVARLKQCCAQLRTQAKAMGSSPEAGMITAAAAQCDTMAGGLGASGTAPELGVIKGLLAGRNIPPICAGF